MRSGSWGEFPPACVDDYEVIRPLATGAMGAVYLARDRLLERPVALKFIAASNGDPRADDRFVAEARALARVDHPNVVRVYRIAALAGRPYMAYEFVDGTPLHRLPRPLPWRQALELGLGMARGLAAVHAAGLLHRDIKPANAVVARDGTVKLLDFGLAEPARADEPELAVRWSGTPIYMAPELLGHTPASPRSDLYSLGLVLWELLAGDLPHAERDAEDVVAHLLTHGVPPIGAVCADVPVPLADLVDRLVAQAPAQRPRSAAATRDRLELLRAIYAPLPGEPAGDPLAGADGASRLIASFERVAADPGFVAGCYRRAFAAAPSLRARLPLDLSAHQRSLLATLHTVVHGARTPALIVPVLEDLGARYADDGLTVDELERFGRALLATIAELDAAAWTPALAQLWTRTTAQIAAHLRRGMTRARARGSAPLLEGGAAATGAPPPRYARAGDAVLGYTVGGDGPRDLVLVPGWVSHVERAWAEPGFAGLMGRLARRARVVHYDRRGTGLSERDLGAGAAERHVADLLAVLDAVGVERAVLLALHDAEALALAVAARHPERVRALVVWGGHPASPGAWLDQLGPRWGEPVGLDVLAPSRASDPQFAAWWASYLRAGTTPATAAAIARADADADPLGARGVAAPTLILRRAGDALVPRAASEALAARIAGARLVELPGRDHLAYADDVDAVAAEIEAFVLDAPTAAEVRVRVPARARDAAGPSRI